MSLGKWIGLFAFIVSLYILWQIRQVLLLIFAAVVLANALNVLVERFQRSGMKRGFAVLLSVLLLIAILVGFFWVIVPPFAAQLQQLSQLVPRGIQRFSIWIETLQTRLSPQLIEYIPDIDQLIQQLQPLANRLLGGGFTFFSNSVGFLAQFLLVIVLTLMLLADPVPYRQSFIRLFPSFYRRRIDEILEECNVALRGWLVGILFNMFVIASFSFVGLLVLRVPVALAQAALAGILTFIPNIGPALSVVPPMAIALLDSPLKSLAVLILYVVIQQVESNLLTPYVMAQQVSLLPAITLLAQVFFATFFGFLGLLLALPLTVVGQVWLKEVIIKDILDEWHHSHERQTKFVIVSSAHEVADSSESPKVTESSEEAENLAEQKTEAQERVSTDEFHEKT
ncbi:MAG: AI-2E family transporter [Coleofasciculus sp. S288]|nr:AI-2E family transporter [Coleofasciculus sp. S288]